MLVSMPLIPTDLPAPVIGDQQVRHGGEIGDVRFAVNRLAEHQRELGGANADTLPIRALAQ